MTQDKQDAMDCVLRVSTRGAREGSEAAKQVEQGEKKGSSRMSDGTKGRVS